MAQPRPGALTAAAIMSIIYGSLFSVCGLCGAVGLIAQGAIDKNFLAGNDPRQARLQKEIQDTLDREVPAYQAVQISGTLIGLVNAAAILIGGIGLLNVAPWARTTVMIFALVAILTTAFQAIYQVVFVMPAMNDAFQVALPAAIADAGPGPPPQQVLDAMKVMMTVIAILTVVFQGFWIVYLIVIPFLLRRPQVSAAFAGAPMVEVLGGEAPQAERYPARGYDEPGWDQPPRYDEPGEDTRIK